MDLIGCYQTTVQVIVELDLLLLLGAQQPNSEHHAGSHSSQFFR